jgi:outer membrane immunogenic protein
MLSVPVWSMANWIVGVEHNCMDFGGKNWNGNSTGRKAQPESFDDNLKILIVTGRISYKFGGPMVAKF